MQQASYELTERLMQALLVAGTAKGHYPFALIELHAALDEARQKADSIPQHVNGCTGKEPFVSYTVAMEVAGRKINRGLGLKPYSCEACNCFHLGSNGKARRS